MIAIVQRTDTQIVDERPLELRLYDSLRDSSVTITQRAREITWAEFDDSLYFWGLDGTENARVFQLTDAGLKATEHKHLDFSPDGKYYLGNPFEEVDNLTIYDRKSDEKVVPEGLHHLDAAAFARFFGVWLDSEWLRMWDHKTSSEAVTFLLNIETGAFRKLRGYVIHKCCDAQKVLVLTNEGKIEERELEKAPAASPLELAIPPEM